MIFLIFMVNCPPSLVMATKVYISNETFADINVELVSTDSSVGNNDVVTVGACNTEVEIKCKPNKSLENKDYYLYYWWDDSDSYEIAEYTVNLTNPSAQSNYFSASKSYTLCSENQTIIFPSRDSGVFFWTDIIISD